MPALCGQTWLGAKLGPGSLTLALALNPPAKLAAGWALMIAAMMAPLVAAPLRHLSDRSFAWRRWRAMLLFAAGYGAVWMAAGAALESLVLAARLAAATSLPLLGGATALALIWQVSPAKQRSLNGCHRRPEIAAFGAAADRDALWFGLTHGASCVSACWALMLLQLVIAHGHTVAMAAVALFLFAERFERPAPLSWRWRGPGKAPRLAAAQLWITVVGPLVRSFTNATTPPTPSAQ